MADAAARPCRLGGRMTMNDRIERSSLASFGLLVSTLFTVPAALVAFWFAAIAQMQCDSCFGAEADRFYASHDRALVVLLCGFAFTGGLLVASWALPSRRRYVAWRAACALLAPVSVLVLFFGVFMSMVDWPD
jgi:hypothetical protein